MCAVFGCMVVCFGSVASYASFAAVMAATKVGFRVCVPSKWMVMRRSKRVSSFCGIWLGRGVWVLLMCRVVLVQESRSRRRYDSK